MDIRYYLESGILERYALDQLSKRETDRIKRFLETSLEMGEALEKIYIKLEHEKIMEIKN